MRAWQVTRHGAPREALELVDREVPEPGPGLLRIRVAAAALGLPDLFMCRGSYALTPELPFTPGQELAGVVSAAGEGASARVGERVMAVSAFFLGRGAFAEECLALDDFAFGVSDGLSDAEAAGFTIPFHTAYVGLVRRAELAQGETLLVLGGAGGTGSAAIQLASALGARVLTTASGPAKAAFCRALGADLVIDPREQDIAEAVREATGGRGVEVVYDPVGGGAFKAATRCIAHEGRVLIVGFASGEWGRPSAAHIATHNYSVLGVIPSAYDRSFRLAAQQALMAHAREGRIRVPIHGTHPFEALPDALVALEDRTVMGKSILDLRSRD
jgi:NADPH2:quinone reductase